MIEIDESKYTITEKVVEGIRVWELRPIKTAEQDKRDREHTTRLCIKALEKYHRL